MISSQLNLKLIIGLGNPDPQYKNTYHNTGALFAEYFKKFRDKPTLIPYKLAIFASEAYVNNSGRFVIKMMRKHNARPDELLIAHDDSDLELGKYKLVFGRGAAGHHGIENIQAALKTKDFWRLRIGIRPSPSEALAKEGRRPKAGLPAVARRAKAGEFVLKKISPAHKKILNEVFEKTAAELN